MHWAQVFKVDEGVDSGRKGQFETIPPNHGVVIPWLALVIWVCAIQLSGVCWAVVGWVMTGEKFGETVQPGRHNMGKAVVNKEFLNPFFHKDIFKTVEKMGF